MCLGEEYLHLLTSQQPKPPTLAAAAADDSNNPAASNLNNTLTRGLFLSDSKEPLLQQRALLMPNTQPNFLNILKKKSTHHRHDFHQMGMGRDSPTILTSMVPTMQLVLSLFLFLFLSLF